MELKYPRISSGIKFIYASWWCSLLSVVAGIISTMLAWSAMRSNMDVWIAMGLETVLYGLQVVGFCRAAKEDKRYKRVYYMLVAELIIAAVVLVVTIMQYYLLFIICGIVGGLVCAVLEPLRLYLFVKYTEDLVQQNGDAGVNGYTRVIRNCYIICYGGVFAGGFVTGMESLFWLGMILVIAAVFSALALYIFYGIFLCKTNDFFKKLEKTERNTSWEEFNSQQLERLFFK